MTVIPAITAVITVPHSALAGEAGAAASVAAAVSMAAAASMAAAVSMAVAMAGTIRWLARRKRILR
jgi:hypothetical protein